MNAGGSSLKQQCAVGQIHTVTGSQHRVNQNQCLAVQFGRCHILNVHIKVNLIQILAVGRYERVLAVVKVVVETLVQRQSGTEYGTKNNILFRDIDGCGTKRGCYLFCHIVEFFAYLQRHNLTDTLQIAAETQLVLLDVYIADFGDELVQNTVLFVEINYFHIVYVL